MIGSHCLTLIIQISQFEGGQREAAEALRVVAGIFALILSALSLYAWIRRKQPALLIVSLAFFLFFLTHVVEIVADVYEFSTSMDLVLVLMDCIILALFFVAIVVRPKRRLQEQKC